jgi:MFS family permease
MLAPYVGITLQTYTAIIGTVLAGISVGAWGGGFVADRVNPRLVLGPLVLAGGALSILIVPIIRALGRASIGDVRSTTVFLTIAAFFLPSMVLSAVTPTVVKLELHDLSRTGRVVGTFSAIGTLGALVGTFVTGFILVAELPTRTVIYSLGGLLVALGIGLWLWLSRRWTAITVVLLAVTATGVALTASAHDPCDIESAYACLYVEQSLADPNGRILWENNLVHSFVDLTDPTRLKFEYTKDFADVTKAAWPQGVALDSLQIGGGGFTMPNYLAAVRPGSRSTVLELDPAAVLIARQKLGLRSSPQLQIKTGDARTTIRGVPAHSFDLVIGDAFTDLTVPWQLTTREFVSDIDHTLRPKGVYMMNVVDAGSLRFLRSEIATLRERFQWVAAISSSFARSSHYANYVLAASHRELDHRALVKAASQDGEAVLDGVGLVRLAANAKILTDDYAPVDQWVTRAGMEEPEHRAGL